MVSADDATVAGLTTAHTGSTVAGPAPNEPANPGFDLIRHRVQSVPTPTVTGLAGQALTLGRGPARRSRPGRPALDPRRPGRAARNTHRPGPPSLTGIRWPAAKTWKASTDPQLIT